MLHRDLSRRRPVRRRFCRTVLFAGLALLWPSLQVRSSEGSAVRIAAPATPAVLSAFPPLPATCQPVALRDGTLLPCKLDAPVKLTLAIAGYEPRTVVLSSDEVELDLREGWVPTPVPVRLVPKELAAHATAVWLEGSAVITAAGSEGTLWGPRVPPGERVLLAIVGRAIAPVLIERDRHPEEEPLEVSLRPGQSVALVCRDPWGGNIVEGCEVEVGKPSDLLERLAALELVPAGHTSALGDLLVADLEGDDIVAIARAGGLAPAISSIAADRPVYELVLDEPCHLHVSLEDARSRRAIGGRVRVVDDQHRVLLVEAEVDEYSGAVVALRRGRYTLFAEAPGHRPARAELAVKGLGRKTVTLRLGKAETAAGYVVTDNGEPVSGAFVAALAEDLSFESLENGTTSDAAGAFQLTLPGDGPWTIVAEHEGFAPASVRLLGSARNLRLALGRLCQVRLAAVRADGSPFQCSTILVFRPGEPTRPRPARCEADGSFRVELGPGNWTVVVEEERLWGTVELPDACDGLDGFVVLRAGAEAP